MKSAEKMTVPFVDYCAHYKSLEGDLKALLDDVLFTRADLIMRGDMITFEKNLASFLGVKDCVALANCTDALYLCLRAAGIGPGDEVITVSHTFLATIAAIHHVGATPVLIDIGDDDLMDTNQLANAITSKTRAIMPVHLNGRICEMDPILELAEKHNLLVIEDSAQALGATYRGRKGGSIGLAGCFSFYPAKLLGAAGDAGAVSTNDAELAKNIRLLRDHGRLSKDNDFCYFGFNSRMDNIQAAILNYKLVNHFDKWLERRREVAAFYEAGLRDLPLRLPVAPKSNDLRFDVYQNYAVKTPRRDALVAHLTEAGIETIISWKKPAHSNPGLHMTHFSLPRTDQLCNEVVSLPMNCELSNEQVEYVIHTVQQFFA